MSEEFTSDDFIAMADFFRTKTIFLRMVVKREDYRKLTQAIVDSGVEIEWSVLQIHTKVSPLAPDAEFKG